MPDRLTTLFADVLRIPADTLNDESAPANTPQWDSLATVNLTVALEQAFGITLRTREITAMATLGLARQVLRAKGIDTG